MSILTNKLIIGTFVVFLVPSVGLAQDEIDKKIADDFAKLESGANWDDKLCIWERSR